MSFPWPCIPVLAPARHLGPRVAPAQPLKEPKPLRVFEPLAPTRAPAPKLEQPAPASAPLLGVRLGRLPPRDVAPRVTPAPDVATRLAAGARAPLPPITPTLPRAPITEPIWQRVTEAGARLGIATLRPEQRRAIRAVLEGRDALVALASGAGKSACYLVPALLLEQPSLVTSSRPHLLRNLYDRLLQRRIPVAWLDARGGRERAVALSQIATGGPLVVLATPEALASQEVLVALAHSGISFVAVDDAHAASEWSDELRPATALLAETLTRLGSPPAIALLGAATAATRHDVIAALALRAPVVVEGPALRDNVALDVMYCRGEVRQRLLIELVMRFSRPGIVYCSSPREVDAVHGALRALRALRLPVHRYHSLMPPGERLGEQLNFCLPGRRSILVAESAGAPTALAGVGEAELIDRAPDGFGLGLDKRDLRFVIHYGAPTSLERYAREIGAAGRDGAPANAVLLHAPEDRGKNESLLAELRIAPAHVLKLARALEPFAVDRQSATLEALALSAGLSRRATESASAALEDAGAISRSGGWARVLTGVAELLERSRRVAGWLETLRREDARRVAAVCDYAAGDGCRSAAFARWFGAAPATAPCACAACNPGLHPVATPTIEMESRQRRPPARELTVRRFDERGIAEPRSVLTAKLGDFGVAAGKAR